MTTLNQAREAVYQCFAANWLVPGPDGPVERTPYTFDNEAFAPPAGPWVRLTIRHLTRRQISMGRKGNRRWETRALLIIEYYEPPSGGTADADGHLDAAKDIFEGSAIAGTTCKFEAAIPRERGVIEQGAWWAANSQIEFTYEEIR